MAVESLEKGPEHLNYLTYEALVTPEILRRIARAQQEGYHAVVVGCFNDTAVPEGREIATQMAVVGPGEASFLLASSLGRRWCVLVSEKKCIPRMTQNAIRYGFDTKFVRFRTAGIAVHDFQADPKHTEAVLFAEARDAIDSERAEVVILGCTAQFGFYERLQRRLAVPVLDAAIVGLKQAEHLIELGITCGWHHSKALSFAGPSGEDFTVSELS